jgi:hypothetical protein
MTSTFSPCSCGTALNPEDHEDCTSRYTTSSVKTHSTTGSSSDDSDVLNTSYRQATPLFRAIEKENWEGIRQFLTTGKWSTSFFQGSNEHLKSPGPALQVKTWVTAYDRHDAPEWSQLPLHAAISYTAPFVIIQKLVELYPKSVQCTDNEGMLPIHLAYGFGAPDAVLEFLLAKFPDAANEKGLGGRRPHECCELGPNKARGEAYRIVLDQFEKRVRRECDAEWRQYTAIAAKKQGLDGVVDVSKVPLTDLLLSLMRENQELREFKAKRMAASSASRRGGASSSPRRSAAAVAVAGPESSNKKAEATRKGLFGRSKTTRALI